MGVLKWGGKLHLDFFFSLQAHLWLSWVSVRIRQFSSFLDLKYLWGRFWSFLALTEIIVGLLVALGWICFIKSFYKVSMMKAIRLNILGLVFENWALCSFYKVWTCIQTDWGKGRSGPEWRNKAERRQLVQWRSVSISCLPCILMLIWTCIKCTSFNNNVWLNIYFGGMIRSVWVSVFFPFLM